MQPTWLRDSCTLHGARGQKQRQHCKAAGAQARVASQAHEDQRGAMKRPAARTQATAAGSQSEKALEATVKKKKFKRGQKAQLEKDYAKLSRRHSSSAGTLEDMAAIAADAALHDAQATTAGQEESISVSSLTPSTSSNSSPSASPSRDAAGGLSDAQPPQVPELLVVAVPLDDEFSAGMQSGGAEIEVEDDEDAGLTHWQQAESGLGDVSIRPHLFQTATRAAEKIKEHYGLEAVANLHANLCTSRLITLYSGLGGAELAFAQADTAARTVLQVETDQKYRTVFACECDPECHPILQAHEARCY